MSGGKMVGLEGEDEKSVDRCEKKKKKKDEDTKDTRKGRD
jgi:hypothetical protein